MNLGMGEGAKIITLTSGTTLSDNVYIQENSSSGNRVSLESKEVNGKTQTFFVYPNSIGKQNVTFQLIKKTGTNISSIVKRLLLHLTSHVFIYDNGDLTVEPTTDHIGVMIYTCLRCKGTKTETIPKL